MALSLLGLGVLLTTPEASWAFARHRESCARKIPYLTAAEALAAKARGPWADDATLQVYGCTACAWFHLGRYAGVAE